MKKILLFILLMFSMFTYAAEFGFASVKIAEGNRFTRINVATDQPTAIAQAFCQGATVADLVATGSNLQWYDVDTAGTALVNTAVLTTKTYYVSQTISGEESARTAVEVTVNVNPLTPILYTNPAATFCTGESITISANETNSPFMNANWAGGTQVDCHCPSGYVAVGYTGNSDAWLDGMQLACKKLNADGTLDSTIEYTSKIGGNNGLANGPYLLTGNNVMVGGETETEYNGNYVSNFKGYGQSVDYILANGDNTTSPVSIATLGPSGTFLGSLFSPNGSVIVGMSGWVNGYVTGISFIYRPINMINKDLTEDSYSWSNGSTTRNITVDTPGTYTLTVTNQNGCKSTASQEVVMDPLSVGGTVTGGTTVNYNDTSAELTLSGHLGTVVRWESAVSPYTTWTPIANTTTSYTSGALTQTTQFRAVVQSGVCSTAFSAPTTVSVITTVVWNGSEWAPNAPTSLNIAYMTGSYNSSSNGGSITARELYVNGGDVVIEAGHTVTLNGILAINSPGTFTLNNNANLVQINNVSNYGNITIKRDTAPLMRLDYVMWSSPVGPFDFNYYLQAFSPSTISSRFYTYNGLATPNVYEAVTSPSTTEFEKGIGYLIRLPNDHPTTPTVWTGTFTGRPNNGDVNLSGLTSGKYYAVGNPYPSTISADSFMSTNGISEALYFWRKTNNANNSSYATYTTAGGVANTGGDSLLTIPNGYIQVGQGFIVKTTSTDLAFTNNMRLPNDTDAPFLKTKNPQLGKSRIWLNLTNDSGVFCQTLIAYMSNATSGIDPAIDGHSFKDSKTALTSLINDEEFSIQGRSLPFDSTDIVPLAFKTASDGIFTISIAQVDGLFSSGQEVILKDNTTGTETDLNTTDYVFTANAVVDNNRFSLQYQKALGTNSNLQEANGILVSKKNGVIKISSRTKAIDSVKIFNISGSLLLEKSQVNATETTFEINNYTNQVLIIQIKSEGKIINKKTLN